MQIASSFLGTQDVNPETLITFPDGLPGFESAREFKLFHEEGKPTVYWLQSVDDPDLSFSVAQPQLFSLAYEVSLSDAEAERIKLQDPADAVILLLLSKPVESGEDHGYDAEQAGVHSNIRAPLIINGRERLGLQKVINTLEHTTLLRAVD